MTNIFKTVGDALKNVFDFSLNTRRAKHGDVAEQNNNLSAEQQNILSAYAKEFQSSHNWWDSFWNGINRMPRPLFVVTIFIYFNLSWANSELFDISNEGLSRVPKNMWWIMGAIISFYFGSRHFQKMGEMKTRRDNPPQPAPLPTEDLSRELNPSIVEWKSKKQIRKDKRKVKKRS